ncbi:hypothetical protein RUM44_004052 [Polyplax serrata]|uniref:Uncharacterized protein n=1 Tax=Polyplax serrata TaxID=468196 RepID=A0ABR1B1Q9_POLSC
MKYFGILLLALVAVCLASEQKSTEISAAPTKAPPAKSSAQGSTRKPELKKSEGRGSSRLEVSDAQLEMALKDKRYLQRQLKCTLGEAPCDPVGRRLRTLAPLVVRGSCPQCTPTEMRQIQKVLLHMQRNFPKEWARIVRTYQ